MTIRRLYWFWVSCSLLAAPMFIWSITRMTTGLERIAAASTPAASDDLANAMGTPTLVMLGSLVLIVLGVLAGFRFLYRTWKAVQDGVARTTPTRAVALLFVPVFNWYWIFVAIAGLGAELNRVSHARGIANTNVPYGLGLAACVGSLLSMAISGSALWHISLTVALASLTLHFIYMWFVAHAAQQISEGTL